MSDRTIDPDRAELLRSKYITPPDDLATAGIKAQAEQLSLAVMDARRGVEAHNAALGLAWLNWRTPPSIGERCDAYMARLREAQARQSRGGGTFVIYHDDRNKHDVANGWVRYNPDVPSRQAVPLGHVLAGHKGTMTVYVLRAGTEPLFDDRDHLGSRERPGDRMAPHAELPNYGRDFDVETFLRGALHHGALHFCDLRLPGGCRTGIGGGKTTLIAVAQGRNIFAVNACPKCLAAAECELIAEVR